jgi:hypothetical protein
MRQRCKRESKSMNDQSFWRQLGIIEPQKLKIPITIIGAGSIGSITTMILSKMGCNDISVYDFDTIEDHNMPNQFYKMSDLGRPKVEALKDIVKEFSGFDLKAYNEKFDYKNYGKITISAVDTMSVRRDIFEKSLMNIRSEFLIDGRMGGEYLRLYALNTKDLDSRNKYQATLYSDEEASEEKCTEKTIVYNVSFIGSMIGSYVKKYVNRENNIPFDLQMDFKTMWSQI